MYKYQNKIYKAIQFNGYNWAEITDFAAQEHFIYPSWIKDYTTINIPSKIHTDINDLKIYKNDYLVQDEEGNNFVVAQDLFEVFYEKI